MRDLYCYECSLQFDKKCAFDVHLSVVYGEGLEIKLESKSQSSVTPQSKELERTHTEEENSREIESKRTGHEGQKSNLNSHVHVATVHERKKPFKCDLCNAEFTSKQRMKGHIATIHEGEKQFKCDIP